MPGNYPDLAAPIVPDAQRNKGAEILLEGLHTGLSFMAQMTQERRQREMELLKLAAQERIAADQHAVEREKIYKDTQVQDAMIKSHGQYYEAMGNAAMTKAAAYSRGVEGMVNQDAQKTEFMQGFKDRADELGLNNPNLEKDDPAQFYLNARELQRQYGTSTMPGISKAITAYRVQAEKHRIPLPQVTYDESGQAHTVGGGANAGVVVGQIVDGLHDPQTRSYWMDRLKAGGHIAPAEKGKDLSSWWQKAYYAPDKPATPDATAQGLLNKADTGDFGGAAPVIQPDLNKKARDFRAVPLPSPDIPVDTTTDPSASAAPASSGTPETDAMLQAAQAAIQKGAPMAQVLKRLADYGIDASQLA